MMDRTARTDLVSRIAGDMFVASLAVYLVVRLLDLVIPQLIAQPSDLNLFLIIALVSGVVWSALPRQHAAQRRETGTRTRIIALAATVILIGVLVWRSTGIPSRLFYAAVVGVIAVLFVWSVLNASDDADEG
ncbi:MAG: hypothetical protein HY341_01010 [Candidatus Kerfeldbacteria bacterium]|nr:hypothetical protein [Candidatus Kerfeldbacteria bacterium]